MLLAHEPRFEGGEDGGWKEKIKVYLRRAIRQSYVNAGWDLPVRPAVAKEAAKDAVKTLIHL